MCTLVLRHAPGAEWPVLVAANRDEMLNRPWQPPAEHWPGILGGRDTLAGGTWLAVSRGGVVAGVLNRTGSLGPSPGKRSRGDLPLMALAAPDAATGAARIAALDATLWRPFNLIVADSETAWFLRGTGAGQPDRIALRPGTTMVTASDPNAPDHPRVARHLPRFDVAPLPSPPDWGVWPALLADDGGAWEETLNVPERGGFGTASAALIAIGPRRLAMAFCAGRPAPGRFAPVALPPGF